MSILNLSFKPKETLTILAPVVIGVLVHKTPKFLSHLFPSQPDGRVGELVRNRLRLLFDRVFRKMREEDQRFLSAMILDNAGIAAFIVSYEYFCYTSKNSAPPTKGQQLWYFFILMIVSRLFREGFCRIAPIVEKKAPLGGETLGKIFRSLGPSDGQIEIVEEEQNLNAQLPGVRDLLIAVRIILEILSWVITRRASFPD